MTVYGFGRDNAANLLKVARREGLRKRSGSLAKYPDFDAESPPEHIQVWTTDGSPTAGDVLEADADNLFPGRVRFWLDGEVDTFDDCWIKFVDWYDADEGDCYALHGKQYFARLCGSAGEGEDSKPLYIATQGNFECWCKPDADIAAGASGTVSLYNDDFTDSTIDRDSTLAKFIAVKQDKWCLLTRTMGTYICQPAECQT